MALLTEPVDDVVVVPGVGDRSGAVITGVGPGTGRGALARATFEGVASAALAALEAITEAGARWYDHEPIHLAGPADALDAHAQVLANLAGHTVVATPDGLAAAGACVQAAAVLQRAHPAEVADVWDLAAGYEVEPEDDPEREHRLALHAEERERQRRAWLEDSRAGPRRRRGRRGRRWPAARRCGRRRSRGPRASTSSVCSPASGAVRRQRAAPRRGP